MELLKNVRLLNDLTFLSITAHTTIADLEELFKEGFGYADTKIHLLANDGGFTIKCFELDECVVDAVASIGDVIVINEATGAYVIMAHEVFLNVFDFGNKFPSVPSPSLN